MRIRSIPWFEEKILDTLSNLHKNQSNLMLQGLRGVEEEINLDIAIEYLISKGIVKRHKREGITSYVLAA